MIDWYSRQTKFLKERFGNDWQLVAGLLAATSPQVQLKMSWDWSLSIYDAVKAGREPDLSMLWRCHVLNVSRVLAGEPLQGEKVQRFYMNLCGNLDVVTIDTWMLKLFKVDCGTHGKPWPAMYRRMERAFQKWAKSKGKKPAVLQAILWNKIRADYGYKPTSFAIIESESIPI